MLLVVVKSWSTTANVIRETARKVLSVSTGQGRKLGDVVVERGGSGEYK